MNQKEALITGGRGFIGQHLAKHLEGMGYGVNHFDAIDGEDVTNRDLVLDTVRGYDVIFHLAGVLGTHELNDKAYEATQVNVLGALNIFDAARKSGARVVLAAKPNPWLNTYTITKVAAEQFAQMYTTIFGVDIRSARFFSLYGPGQKTKEHGVQKAIPTLIMSALSGEPLPIFGTGHQTADFIHAQDATQAMAILGHMENLAGEVVEVGTGNPTEINFLAEMIIRLSDSRSKIEHLPMRSGEPLDAQVVADTTKMTHLLHFRPTVSLEDGLRETVAWYKHTFFGSTSFTSIPPAHSTNQI
jgi:UDP-glucose 4-epimerase